jgi:signal transduction histidine kinase/DNA-binding response OmpR family regulator
VSTPKKILVIDDEESIRELLIETLGSEGYSVSAVRLGEEGLEKLRTETYHLLLLDLRLPGMHGIDVLREISISYPALDVIIMTSYATTDTAIKALRLGAQDYLYKPFDNLETITHVIKKTIEKRELLEENERLLQGLKTKNAELDAAVKRLTSLIEAGKAMSAIHDPSELLDFFIGLVVAELDVDRASVMLLDENTQQMHIAASRGISEDIVQEARVKLGEGIAGQVAREGRPILVEDIKTAPGVKARFNPKLSDSFISLPIVLSVPIRLQKKVLGVINVTNKRSGGAFGDKDMGFLLGLAGQAAVAIEGASHFKELQHSYESLKATQDHLVASERLKALGQMAAGVAHDFNNVLNGILMRSQLMLQEFESGEADSEGLRQELELIKRIALQGAETITRIQDFTGIRKDLPADVVDLNAVVRNSVEMTRTKWKDECEAQGIQIDVSLELGDIPSTEGNAYELTQVFSNFIFNAVEAMPRGGSLTIRTYKADKMIRVEVSDTGIGMTEEVQRKIFEPFFTTKKTGHGLGMSIVYGIIKRYQGDTSLRSKENAGSTFTVSLPVISQRPVPEPENPGVDETVIEEYAPARVLVIEDNDQNRKLFETALKHFGHQVVGASNGTEGLELFHQGGFDLVVTDLSMPGLSGWEVAKGVKKEDPGVPVILLSGWSVQQEVEQIKTSGVDLVLAKPCPLDSLRQAVHNVLKNKGKESLIH